MSETAAFPDWVLVAGMVARGACWPRAPCSGAPCAGARGRCSARWCSRRCCWWREIWDSPQIETVRDRGALGAGRGGVGLAAMAGAGVAVRAPAGRASASLALAALPFRVPGAGGRETANLLVPLYVVIGAGALAWLVPRLASRQAGDAGGARGRAGVGAARRRSCSTRVQAIYADDRAKAFEQVVFFYVPFALLFVLLRGLEWTPRRLAWGGGVLVALALVFAGDRLLGVRDAPPAAEPEGDRLQPGRGVLPRQLAVLRPEHLRALPGAGDDRAGDACCCGRGGRASLLLAIARAGRALGRAADDALAVELRRAAARAWRCWPGCAGAASS